MKYSGAVLDNPMEVSTSTIVRILGRCETGGGRIQNFSEAYNPTEDEGYAVRLRRYQSILETGHSNILEIFFNENLLKVIGGSLSNDVQNEVAKLGRIGFYKPLTLDKTYIKYFF